MTEEQKRRRIEIAHENGKKSRGPVSPIGKKISSFNAIASGKHLDLLTEELPEFIAALSTDEIQDYIRLLQKHVRQFQPASECEQTMVRHIAAELFQFQRLTTVETSMMQMHCDDILRKYPTMGPLENTVHAYRTAANDEKPLRSVRQQKKAHLQAHNQFIRTLAQIRKSFPMVPPEPISMTADSNLTEETIPIPEMVDEMLALADRAKNEPAFVPPPYVVKFLSNEPLMKIVAPGYDVADLLVRFGHILPKKYSPDAN